ncbi:MAG: hypothetical protein PHH09_03955 [Methanoregulaceae archaeon]|nr:hypothetical protein [Methanoregulaceae archaeon]
MRDGETEETGAVLVAFGHGIATIGDHNYTVLDFVEKWFSRYELKNGDQVDITWRPGTTEKTRDQRQLTSIKPHGRVTGTGTGAKKPSNKTVEKELVGVFRSSDGVNATIFVNGADRKYCLTKEKANEITEVAANQEIQFVVDKNNFLLRYDLGQVLGEAAPPPAPPGPAPKPEIAGRSDNHVQSITESEAQAGEARSGDRVTSPSLALAKPVRLMLGGTISLEGYENIKCELEGEVSTPADREALIRYWDETLAMLGRQDPMVRERVDRYRKHVITGAVS